ncbi:MAG TPA: hypothetical protein DCZ91_21185 [Lachnospiraceae bacterium]|nr:hypothetical protein [Lachnospiraceae bacterium]
MAVKVNQYQFDRIGSQMEREFGKIRKGEENAHMMMLFPMEGNMLKVHRAHPESNGRRAIEAIVIALFEIQSYLSDNEYNLDSFRSAENERLVQALLMTFDPFTNRDIREALEEASVDLESTEALKELYGEPVRCLLKIKESVELWSREWGPDGYFRFIENMIGKTVKRDQEMNFAVLVPGVEMKKKFHLFGKK